MVQLGHIFSDEPRATGCFRALLIRHPLLRDPEACVQVAYYTMGPLSGATATKRPLNFFQRPPGCFSWLLCSAPLLLQGFSAVSSILIQDLIWYFALFWSFASSNLSSQGAGSSKSTTCMVDSEIKTISGRLVIVMDSGKSELAPYVDLQVPVPCGSL